MSYCHTEYKLYVKGDHPHYGELCNPLGEDKRSISSMKTIDGKWLYLMRSISSGVEFYVEQENLDLIEKPLGRHL